MADQTAQAEQNVGALTDQARKASAYNTFAAAHGPVAAYGLINPEAAQESQNYLLRGQTDPIAVQQAAATLAGTQAQTGLAQAGAAKDTAITSSLNFTNTKQQQLTDLGLLAANAGSDGSIDQNQALAYLRKHGSDINVDPDQYGAIAARLAQPHQLDKAGNPIPGTSGLDALNNYRQGLTGAAKATGNMQIIRGPDGNPIVLQNSGLGVKETELPAGSTTAPLLQASTAQAREGVYAADDPIKAAADLLRAKGYIVNIGREANNSPYGLAPGTSLPSLPGDNISSANFGGGNALPRPSTDLIGAGNPPGSRTVGAPPPLTGKPLATRTGQAQVINNADTNFNTASQVINQLEQQAGAYTTGAGSWGDWLRGSQAANLRANAAALRGQVGNAIISSMKNAQGQMGFRMTQQEFKTLTDSLGALGTEQSADQFKQHLGYVRNALQNFNQTMHAGFQTQYGTTPRAALGLPEPGQGGNQPSPQDIVNELRRRGVVK